MQSVIDAVAAAGFDVYMRDPRDTYLLFTDGKNIGYLQDDRLAGYCISTVHMPNTTTGTGFQIERHVSGFTPEMLRRAFATAPSWAAQREFRFPFYGDVQYGSVRKYRDMEHYLCSDSWHAGYRLVAKGKVAA